MIPNHRKPIQQANQTPLEAAYQTRELKLRNHQTVRSLREVLCYDDCVQFDQVIRKSEFNSIS